MQTEKQMTLKDWILTLVLLFIPIVGLVMLIIWATDKQDPRNIFAKAYLIVSAGMLAIVFIFYVFIFLFFLIVGVMVS
ncbi:hypothetical protein [Sporosarcina koreensis]|uniref:hypothetical protein n=1 Tax=Bacillales TaxID=1385 RepID=UPI0007587D6F|nr:hypothetical protein [Sporosarcina koreensis]